ncbi:hypothetical protein BgiMline_020480 [Biomphalaria glabrata]
MVLSGLVRSVPLASLSRRKENPQHNVVEQVKAIHDKYKDIITRCVQPCPPPRFDSILLSEKDDLYVQVITASKYNLELNNEDVLTCVLPSYSVCLGGNLCFTN